MHATIQGDAWLFGVWFIVLQGYRQKRSTVAHLESLLGATSTSVKQRQVPCRLPHCLSAHMSEGEILYICQLRLKKESVHSFVSSRFLSLLPYLASLQRAAPLL